MTAGVAPATVSAVPWIGICLFFVLGSIIMGISLHVSRRLALRREAEEEHFEEVEIPEHKVMPNIYDPPQTYGSRGSVDEGSVGGWAAATVPIPSPARGQTPQRHPSSGAAYQSSSHGVGTVSGSSDRTYYQDGQNWSTTSPYNNQYSNNSRGTTVTAVQFPQRGAASGLQQGNRDW